jgi:hypothetical protein
MLHLQRLTHAPIEEVTDKLRALKQLVLDHPAAR